MRTSAGRRPLPSLLLVLLAALATLGLAAPALTPAPDEADQQVRHLVSELAHPNPTLRGRHAHAVATRGNLATEPVLVALLPPAEPVPEPLGPLESTPREHYRGSVTEPAAPVGSRAPPTVG